MRSFHVLVRALVPVALLGAAACSKSTIITDNNGGGTPGVGAGYTGPSLIYTPAGCSYQVRSPEQIIEASYLDPAHTTNATQPPDHVHASYAGDPSTTFAVNWRSPENTAYTTDLLYGTDEAAVTAATGSTDAVKLQYGHTLTLAGSLLDSEDPTDPTKYLRLHEVHVCGLTPGTKYFYKVGNVGAYSKTFPIVTGPAPSATAKFRFAVSGDARDNVQIWADAQKQIQALGPAFQLFSGDAVLTGGWQSLWNNFFESKSGGQLSSDVLASIPIMMANGNHESLAVNYVAQFALPQVAGGGETPSAKAWYSFNYGNAHFIFLNDTTASGDTIGGSEATWLKADLAAVDRAKTPWVFVSHHQPLYTCSQSHLPYKKGRESWQPIFDQYHVDMVFAGHNHEYERSFPINGFQSGSTEGQVVSDMNKGTVYIVSAGVGAGLYDVNTNCNTQVVAKSVVNYVIIDIDGQTIHYKAYNETTNTVLDSFDFTKG